MCNLEDKTKVNFSKIMHLCQVSEPYCPVEDRIVQFVFPSTHNTTMEMYIQSRQRFIKRALNANRNKSMHHFLFIFLCLIFLNRNMSTYFLVRGGSVMGGACSDVSRKSPQSRVIKYPGKNIGHTRRGLGKFLPGGSSFLER